MDLLGRKLYLPTFLKLHSTTARLSFILLLTSLSRIAAGESYAINPGDVLRIDVWNEDSLAREVLVRPDGIISLPMAGDIETFGKTTSEVEGKIASALSAFMKDKPRVVVSLVAAKGNIIYVIGKVASPGLYQINSSTDVMQALALAGGPNSFADENDIRILRRDDQGVQRSIRFRYADVKYGKSLESNILLQSRDVVVVP